MVLRSHYTGLTALLQYLERELERRVGLEETGVKLFREADGLADLAGEHEPLNGLPVAYAREIFVDFLAGAPVESLGGGAERVRIRD